MKLLRLIVLFSFCFIANILEAAALREGVALRTRFTRFPLARVAARFTTGVRPTNRRTGDDNDDDTGFSTSIIATGQSNHSAFFRPPNDEQQDNRKNNDPVPEVQIPDIGPFIEAYARPTSAPHSASHANP